MPESITIGTTTRITIKAHLTGGGRA